MDMAGRGQSRLNLSYVHGCINSLNHGMDEPDRTTNSRSERSSPNFKVWDMRTGTGTGTGTTGSGTIELFNDHRDYHGK